MELLYNPDRMPEEEIKATFVAREQLVEELVALVEGQPDGAGVQHAVIIAPRGMGKTTVLLMVKFAIKDRGLDDRWQAVKFPEESYGIYDLADFWIETLNLISADTADPELRQLADNLKIKYPNNDELQEAAYAALKDWRRKHGKRLLLLVENFDQILEQINDERDNARLRDALMNDGAVMVLGGATTFFKEAHAYDQPLYNFFKIYDLADLKFAQMQELLRRRAKLDGLADFETKLKQNTSRLRALEYFTGGNPRLVLILYRVVSRSDITEVRRALEKLLDEVTPYYKAKVEALPAQQRKILDHIARVSGETNEGLTPKEIAEAVRLSPNQVSSQLKRLSELGYVRAANLRGRSSYYTLSEPLYAIWHQMRLGRDARERMQWLITFLRRWYNAEEMKVESIRLEMRFREYIQSNFVSEARDTLEHHHYLALAMKDIPRRIFAMESVICGYIELGDAEIIKGELQIEDLVPILSTETLNKLRDNNYVSEQQVISASLLKVTLSLWGKNPSFFTSMLSLDDAEVKQEEIFSFFSTFHEKFSEADVKEAFNFLFQVAEVHSDLQCLKYFPGCLLALQERFGEALDYFDKLLESNPNDHECWFYRGSMLIALKRCEEGLTSINRSLRIAPNYLDAWLMRGLALLVLERYEEALASYNRALEAQSSYFEDGFNRGIQLARFLRSATTGAEEKIILKANPFSSEVWKFRGVALSALERYEEAISSYDRALEIRPDDYDAWCYRGNTLSDQRHYEEAIASYDKALEINPDVDRAWLNRGIGLGKLGRYEEAVASFNRVLEISPKDNIAWLYHGAACLEMFAELAQQDNLNAAKQKWNKALESGSKSKHEKWPDVAAEALLEVAKTGQLEFARQLIAEAGMEGRLFPLARAIDYLQTGDEALIEKLSPEVRGIVEEVVAKLRVASTMETMPSEQASVDRSDQRRRKKRLKT